MIGASRAAAYRRFYLYSALSVAVIALSAAIALLLREALQAAGFGVRSLPSEASKAIALSAALIAFALPIGGVHGWFILRSLAVPAERASTIRDQFLNLWVGAALIADLFVGVAAINTLIQTETRDVTGNVAVMTVAAVVGAIFAWWIGRTPAETLQPRVRVAVVVMIVSMATAAFSLANAAAAAGGLVGNVRSTPPYGGPFDITVYRQRTLDSGVLAAGLGLAIWAFAFAWQRSWPATRDRLGYALAGYGSGTALALIGGAYAISGTVRFARDPAQVSALTGPWPALAAGVLLLLVHGAMLVLDRGRNGHPAVTTDRLLLAFPAIVGLGCVVAGVSLGWRALLQPDIPQLADYSDQLLGAAALGLTGLCAYSPSWLGLRRRTTADSAVRRFYLFTVVCLALVAGLVSGVVALYNAITVVAGVPTADGGRTALSWALPALVLAAVFAAHLMLLLRDQRLTRATDAAVPADPLVALLEEVRAGRMSVERAAATIRGPGP